MATVNFIKYKRQSAGALSGVTQYVSQEEKIRDMDGRQLVSGQNCTPQLADREFQATRDACRKAIVKFLLFIFIKIFKSCIFNFFKFSV